MRLTVNGDQRDVEEVGTVAELLKAFKLEHKILVVELNLNIIERGNYEITPVRDGDRVEIVHFVGGG